MSQAVARTPAAVARHDLTARQAVVGACVMMLGTTLLDLADGRLGLLFSVAFVLTVVTVPMAVDVRALLPAGVLPPALLVGTLLAVCVVNGSAIRVEGLAADAGLVARLVAGLIDHGMTLVVGHVLALGVIVLRIVTAPTR